MQESARPRGAVSREEPSIPVLAAMSPELKIVHETHKGGVTTALLPGSSTGSSQSSTGSARRLLLSLCGQCCHPQDIEEGGDGVSRKIGEALLHLCTAPYSPQLKAIEPCVHGASPMSS